MRKLISIHPTKWPHIRFALYRRDDGHIQFFEQLLRECGGTRDWQDNQYSGLFTDPEAAKLAMIEYIAEYEESRHRDFDEGELTPTT